MKILIKTVVAAVLAATVFCTFGTVLTYGVETSAQSYVLMNADTGEVLASSNAHKRLSMASTTKIMTAMILAEQNTPEKEIVTTAEMVTVEGSSMGLLPGDTVSYRALLAGMLLSSGNDAANTTAIAIAGSLSAFAELMNKRAAEIGMTNTHFVTPSGLDDDEHYSTAYDMALLAAEAMKNDIFREVASSAKMTVSYGNPPYNRTLSNHNKLLGSYEYCIGVKTGYTKKSGRCLVSAAKRNGCTVIAVTLNDPDDWDDHTALLEYGLSQLTPEGVTPQFERSLPVVGGTTDSVRVAAERFVCGSTASSKESIIAEINLPPFVYAPLQPGSVIGFVEYSYNGKVIHTSQIYALGDVDVFDKKETFGDKFRDNWKRLFKKFL